MTASQHLAAALTELGLRAFPSGPGRVRVLAPPSSILDITIVFMNGQGQVFAWRHNGNAATHPRSDPDGAASKIAAQLRDR